MRKFVLISLMALLIVNIYIYYNSEVQYDYKVYALKSIYNYIYDSSRTYYLNFYIDENLKEENYTYYLKQDDKKINIDVKDKNIIGSENIMGINYLNISLEFYLTMPIDTFKETYLLLEGLDKYELYIGYFYTYYQKELNYFPYDAIEPKYSNNKLTDIVIKTDFVIDEARITPNINVNLEKNYQGYLLNLEYLENYYLYKTYILILQEKDKYVIDCPRFKINNNYLSENLEYLSEGVKYA